MAEQRQKQLPALTGIRGLAAVWVVIFHVHQLDELTWPTSEIIRHGYLAVDIFFMLSGFVMALSYASMFDRGSVTFRNYIIFMIRRAARVYPLYLVTTLFVVGLNVVGVSQSWTFNWHDLLLNLAMIQGWGLATSINTQSWSVSTEIAAYAAFPLLAWITLFRRAWLSTAAAIVAAIVVVFVAYAPIHDRGVDGPLNVYWADTVYPLARCLSEFVLGLCAYRLARYSAAAKLFGSPFTADIILATMAGLLLIHWSDVFLVALVPFLLVSLALGNRGVAYRLFACRPAVFLGEVSYAVYLLHWQFLRVRKIGNTHLGPIFSPLPSDVISLTVLYGSLLVAAWIAYRFFERPARGWVRQLERLVKRDADANVVSSEEAGIISLEQASGHQLPVETIDNAG